MHAIQLQQCVRPEWPRRWHDDWRAARHQVIGLCALPRTTGCRMKSYLFSKRVGKSSCPLTATMSVGGDLRPAMRQQLFDAAGRVCWQTLQDVAQVLIRVMPVELGRLDQAHRSGRTLATA